VYMPRLRRCWLVAMNTYMYYTQSGKCCLPSLRRLNYYTQKNKENIDVAIHTLAVTCRNHPIY